MATTVYPAPPSGPTIGEITTAITTNAAPAATTVAAITTAGNAAGWGATAGGIAWNQLSNVTPSGTAVNFTGLGSYRYYRLLCAGLTVDAGSSQTIRVNNNANAIYYPMGIWWAGNTMAGFGQTAAQTGMRNVSQYQPNITAGGFDIIIDNLSASSGVKSMKGSFANYFNNVYGGSDVSCVFVESSITQINFVTIGGTFTGGTMTLLGGN
jgi:hypothetical protein